MTACEKCGQPFVHHEISNVNGRLFWVCPTPKEKA